MADIISNYRQLPMGKYLDIIKVSKDETLEEIDKRVKIISILSDMSEEDILNLPLTEFTELSTRARFLEGASTDTQIAKEYIVGDFTLCPVTDHRNIITSQYIDFQEYAKMGDDHLVEILSCLLIPKGKKYVQDYDVIKVQEAIRDYLPVSDAVALSAFFFIQYRQLIKDSLSYSKELLEDLPQETRERLMGQIQEVETHLTSGDGLQM